MTEDNKKEYVKLYVQYRYCRGIEQQFRALQKGFNEIIPQHYLRPFDERELELVVGKRHSSNTSVKNTIFSIALNVFFCEIKFPGGLGTIDLNDWKQHTRLKHCNAETIVVKWFWEILDEYPEEMRARLLQFVTGSSRVRVFISFL